MKPLLLWTPQAREDLMEIYVTIGLEQSAAAERIYTAIESQVETLVAYPQLGVRRRDIAPTARMLVEGMYLVLYETRPDTDDGPIDEVEVVRIVHGHRELSRVF